MATGDPSVRPWRTPPISVSSSSSKRWRGPAPVAEAPPGQLALDVLDGDGQPRRQSLDDHHERLAVGLARREVPQHRRGTLTVRDHEPEGTGSAPHGPARCTLRSATSGRASARRRVSSASAAARITATSGRWPSPQLLLQRRLVHEHPEPVDRPCARRRERRAAAASPSGGTRGRHTTWPGRSTATSNGTPSGSSPPANPTVVALTITSAAASSPSTSPTAGRAVAASAAAASARAGERLTTTTSAAPAATERVDDAARRCPGAEHRARRRPATSTPAAANEATKPSPSVLCRAGARRGRTTTVFTERSASRRRAQLVDRRGDVLLVRRRHRQPAEAERPHGGEGGARRAGRRPRTRRTPSRGPPRRTRRCGSPATASGGPGEPITRGHAGARRPSRSSTPAGRGRRRTFGLVLRVR